MFPTHGVRPDGSCTCLDPTCGSVGKHPVPGRWQDVATTDVGVIDAWFVDHPWANVSIATGRDTGMFVVDVDVPKGGGQSMEEYEVSTEDGVARTLRANTGGGGYHLFYSYPRGQDVTNMVDWLPGVDVRGDGGQVVAPPSQHASGRYYDWADMWVDGPQLATDEMLHKLVRERNRGRVRPDLPSLTEILKGVPQGRRNDVLFREACRLRRILRDEWPAISLIIQQAAAACDPPLPSSEVDAILQSASVQDHVDPPPAWTGANGQVVDGPEDGGRLPLTDDGNARRFVRRWGTDFLWTAQKGWVHWEGRRWQRDDLLLHQDRALETARHILSEAEEIEEPDEQRACITWARSSQMSARVNSTIQLARSYLARGFEDFDRDDWLLNVHNGVVDLRTGALLAHDRRYLITRVVDTSYDPSAQAPQWRDFTELIFPDETLRWYVQKAVGYSLTGVTDEKALFLCHGPANAGKSVFLEALRRTVFGEYAMTAPKSVIMTEVNEHKTELAGLAGARFVTLGEEVDKRDRLRTSVLKALTGGDEMTARFMRQDFFTFVPKLKFWIGTNYKPGLTDFGDAMRTRLKLVPFVHVMDADHRRDREEVLTDFDSEASGILNWALEGLYGWRLEQLVTPLVMEESVEEWFDEEDMFAHYVEERLVLGGGWTPVNDVFQDYTLWMAMRGEGRLLVTQRVFAREMRMHGVEAHKLQNKRGWKVELKTELPSVLTST